MGILQNPIFRRISGIREGGWKNSFSAGSRPPTVPEGFDTLLGNFEAGGDVHASSFKRYFFRLCYLMRGFMRPVKLVFESKPDVILQVRPYDVTQFLQWKKHLRTTLFVAFWFEWVV